MKRKLKFRVWNKRKLRYESTERFRIDLLTGILCNAIGVLLADTDYTVEQFVGMQDKNGLDIYEGDILIIHYNYDSPDGYKESCKNKLLYVAFIGTEYVAIDVHDDSNYYSFDTFYWDFEVIGNIHENEDLLK